MLYESFNSTWSRLVHMFSQHSPDLQMQITFYIEGMKIINLINEYCSVVGRENDQHGCSRCIVSSGALKLWSFNKKPEPLVPMNM